MAYMCNKYGGECNGCGSCLNYTTYDEPENKILCYCGTCMTDLEPDEEHPKNDDGLLCEKCFKEYIEEFGEDAEYEYCFPA